MTRVEYRQRGRGGGGLYDKGRVYSSEGGGGSYDKVKGGSGRGSTTRVKNKYIRVLGGWCWGGGGVVLGGGGL